MGSIRGEFKILNKISSLLIGGFLIASPYTTWGTVSEVKVHANPALAKCVQSYVDLALRSQLDGENAQAYASSLLDLEKSLRLAGVPEGAIQSSVGAIRQLMANSSQQTSILRDALYALKTTEADRRELLICVSAGNCTTKSAGRLIELDPPYELVPEKNRIREMLRSAMRKWISPSRDPGSPLPQVMLLRGQEAGGIEWLVTFFHESGHFADLRLVRRWLDTNLQRMKTDGLAGTDELFQKYVQIKDGKPHINEAFLRIFLESRGPQVGVDALISTLWRNQPGFNASIEAELRNIARKEAMTGLVDRQGRQFDLVSQLAIQENNVFETGNAWAQAMHQSVDAVANRAVQTRNGWDGELDPAEYEILKSITLPRMSAEFKPKVGGEPVQFGYAFLLPSHIEEAREAMAKEGGTFLTTGSLSLTGKLTGQGGTTTLSNLFTVTTDGAPHMGIDYLATPGKLRYLMTLFQQWRDRRNGWMRRGLTQREAGVRAFIEGESPVISYQETQNVIREYVGDHGRGLAKNLKLNYERRTLSEDQAEDITLHATWAPLKSALSALHSDVEIERRLETTAVNSSEADTLRALHDKMDQMSQALVDEALIKWYVIESRVRRSPLQLQGPLALPAPGAPDPAHYMSRDTRASEIYSALIYNVARRLEGTPQGDRLFQLVVERDRVLRSQMGLNRPADHTPRELFDALQKTIGPSTNSPPPALPH